MMKVKGTTLYPQAVYSVLEEIPGVGEYYIEVDGQDALSDEVTVFLSVKGEGISSDFIQEKLQSRLRVRPEVIIQDEETIRARVYDPKSRKPIRFFDKRGQICQSIARG